MRARRASSFFVVALGLLALAACRAPARPAVAPPRKPALASLEMPPDKELVLENAMGKLVEDILTIGAGEYDDRALQRYITEIGGRIARRSERTDITWHFRIDDTPDVGAHALPGGRVAITRGLLAFLGSEAEVAAVLAHEIAHVSFHHSHSKWSPTVPVAEAGEAADAHERARDADQERQADTVGVRYLAEAGYDPAAMVVALRALERGAARQLALARANGEATSDADDFDPHPAPPARLARASVAAGGAGSGKGEWGRERYLERIVGLEWGEGSSVPVVEGGRWIARGEVSFAVPKGYRVKIERGALEAKPESGPRSVSVLRLKKSFVSEVLRGAVEKEPHQAITVAGFPAIVARSDGPGSKPLAKDKDREKKARKDLTAILDAPNDTVIVIVVGSADTASERLLDGFLASAQRDASKRIPRAVISVERIPASARLPDLLRERCPQTGLELASALNDEASLTPGGVIKCVR